MFSSCLHGDAGVAMQSNKPLEGGVALPFPLSCMQQLFVSFDLSFPFVVASMLARLSKPSFSSILPPLERFDRWLSWLPQAHSMLRSYSP
jgi:hypothetical protein